MTDAVLDDRCSAVSAAAGESMSGTAPTDTRWLLVEQPGPWGRDAVRQSGLPAEVVEHLLARADDGVRVQLLRRHGGASGPGTRVFEAVLGPRGATVTSAVLDDVRDLLGPLELTAYDDPLWLVCTNGRRDRCCAALGRPVAAALAERWPEATWETTHLGGHRFSGTLLALPSGYALGRLDARSAVAACERLAAGSVPVEVCRGRAGLPGPAQHVELEARRRWSLEAVSDVVVEATPEEGVVLGLPGAHAFAVVRTTPGTARPQSCGGSAAKAAPVYDVPVLKRLSTHDGAAPGGDGAAG